MQYSTYRSVSLFYIDWDNIDILETARDQRRLLLKEMLHINKLKPQLNIAKLSESKRIYWPTQH
jgi:hypothetical protein